MGRGCQSIVDNKVLAIYPLIHHRSPCPLQKSSPLGKKKKRTNTTSTNLTSAPSHALLIMSASISFGQCASKTLISPARSSSYLNLYIGCRRPIVTGKGGLSCPAMVLDRQQRRMGHSWISGHPHSILYKSSSSAGGSKASSSGCGSASSSHGTSSGTTSSGPLSFLDFAGNSRYQAYNLARFSTFSAASSASPSPPSLAAAGSSKSLEQQESSTSASAPGSSQGQQDPLVSQHHAGSDSKSGTDGQSPASSSALSSAPPTSDNNSAPAAPSSSADTNDDKDDAWAVNESYSGHGGSSTPSSSAAVVPTTGHVDSEPYSQESNDTVGLDSSDVPSRELRPSLSSFKSAADIEASWRRTSDSIPSQPLSTPTTTSASLSSNKPGSLDLSSSTLVQQMLFKERPPHKTDGNGDWKVSEEGNAKKLDVRHDDDKDGDWGHGCLEQNSG